VGNVQFTTSHQHKYFPSIPSHLKIPKVNKHWDHNVVVACLHSQQHWVEQHELLLMDEKNSYDQDNENHCLHQKDIGGH
jgi:hypothetical protein